MHVLTVLDHANSKALCQAIATEFMRGCAANGCSTELADLHAESFSPVWSQADIDGDAIGTPPNDVQKEQERILRANAICLVFPLFWWGMPAMMKGWVDRVWSWGWAYDQLADPNASLQPNRTGLILCAAGARSDEMDEKGYSQALETSWTQGTFGYFGWNPRRLEVLNGSTGSDKRRKKLLQRAYELGRTLPEPGGQFPNGQHEQGTTDHAD